MLTQRHMMFALKGKHRKTTNVFHTEFDRPMKSGEMTANDRKIYILTRKRRRETSSGEENIKRQTKKNQFSMSRKPENLRSIDNFQRSHNFYILFALRCSESHSSRPTIFRLRVIYGYRIYCVLCSVGLVCGICRT